MSLWRDYGLKFINDLLGKCALKAGITRDTLSVSAALKRCSARGLQVGTIIDVGASDGRWTMVAKKIFPETFCLLIEAQQEHQKALEKMKLQDNRVEYVIAAAGDRKGTIYFDADDLFGGLASNVSVGSHCKSVPMVTIDEEISRLKLPPPYFLKLDTHGFELPILKGAQKTLASTSVIVIETYNFRLTSDSLKFHEMCTFMESKQFSCIDVMSPMHRPGDQAFWQMDLVFVPSNNAVFSSNRYLP